jgi:DNA-binding beta-propeller fold protein YncE
VGEDVLYLADEDHKVVRRIPIPVDPQNLGVSVPLPGAPAAVLPLAGRVLVTVRDPGLLLIMKPDAEKGLIETARVELPADAWGVAVTPDEKTALVTSAWTHQLSAVDLGSAAKRWSIDLPREPRAVVVRADGAAAYVTHLTGAAVTRVDDLAGTPKTHPVELPPAPARAPSGKTIDASLAYAAVMNPEGTRLFVPRHALGALGQGSWFGAATVDVLATSNDTPVLGKRMSGLPMARHEVIVKMIDAGLVTNLDIAGADLTPVTQPRAVVYRRRTRTLLVAGEGDDRVAELDALSVAPAMKPLAIYKLAQDIDTALQIPNRGAAPTGLALSADERTLYVYCRATFDLATVALLEASTKADAGAPHAVTLARIADDPLPKEQAFGRRFFHNSTDQFVSGGLGCAGCHPEGRDDGHVWHEAKVMSQNESERTIFIGEPELAPNAKDGKIGYARQTPMLAGRAGFKGPYGWHAQNADLVERLKEGFGLHRWASAYKKGTGEVLARIHYLRAYVQNGLVPPPRPQRELTEGEKRGKEIFNSEAARCAKCHVPEPEYTDRMAYPLNPRLAPPPGFEEDPKSEFKTPSLRFVGGTPPYFHDGRFSTLEQLIDQNNDRMGKTNQLSKDDRAALIAFLRTL